MKQMRSSELCQFIEDLSECIDQLIMNMKNTHISSSWHHANELNEGNQKNMALVKHAQTLIEKIQHVNLPSGNATLIESLYRNCEEYPEEEQHMVKGKLQELMKKLKLGYRTLMRNTNITQHHLDWLYNLFDTLAPSKSRSSDMYDKAGKRC